MITDTLTPTYDWGTKNIAYRDYCDDETSANMEQDNENSSVSATETASIPPLKKLLRWANDKTMTEGIELPDQSFQGIRSIYPQDFITPELRSGIYMLEASQDIVSKAIDSLRLGKLRRSDELIIKFKRMLPELYCCRAIGESFSAIINSISNALTNMNGVPLSETQLVALHTLVTALLREPGMAYKKAVEYVSDFEDAEFEVISDAMFDLLKMVELMDEDEAEKTNENN